MENMGYMNMEKAGGVVTGIREGQKGEFEMDLIKVYCNHVWNCPRIYKDYFFKKSNPKRLFQEVS